MGPCSVPLNGAVTLSAAGEMLKVVPSGLTARKTADPWYPAGHAVLVDQVGVLFTEPLAGCSATPPAGSVLVLASWALLAVHALVSIAPTPIATRPASHLVERPFLMPNTSFIPTHRAAPSLS